MTFAPMTQILNNAAIVRERTLDALWRMVLLVQGGKVDAQHLGHLVVLDDDQVLAREVLDSHILGLGLALQDLNGHLARGIAQVLIVDGEGEQTAGLAHALLAGNEGELVLLADLTDLRSARGDGVVGGE